MAIARKSQVSRATSLLLIIILFCPLTYGKVIYVDDDEQADFNNIQAGIDTAVNGDTVLVAPGEYIITEPVTFRGKAIMVRSEAGPDETTIRMGTPVDPERASVVVFENNETTASVLDGFTITGGKGSWVAVAAAQGWVGGGIYFDASSGTVRNCAIVQNRPDNAGGGVMVYSGSSAILTNCIITDNSAAGVGGVMGWVNSSITVTNCIISGNSSLVGLGGGAFCGGDNSSQKSSMTMTDCIISGNSSRANGGGGVACWYGSLTLTRCAIVSNMAQDWFGGGVYAGHSSATLTNCVIARNTAPQGGGGVCSSYADASIAISNCTIWGNSGGVDGGGGGVLSRVGSTTITNSIICGNTSAKGPEISMITGGKLDITYSNVAGGQTGVSMEGGCVLNWGESNIDADPLFARLGYLDDKGTHHASDDVWVEGDYHLKSQAGRLDPNTHTWIQDDVTSRCIDAGDPNSPVAFEPFPNGGTINMGAYGGTAEASKSLHGKSIYIFMPGQSMVIQTGGIAGVNWTYTLAGQFQLTIDYGAGKGWFSNVEAIATGHSEPDRTLDPNDVFNLTGLTGIISKAGYIEFTGRTADESNVLLYLTLSDEWISLKGQTTPPPNSADFFIFDLDAVAKRKYSGGTGESNYPYLIYSADHLNTLGAEPNDWDKHFKLMADINLSEYSYETALIAPDVDPCDLSFNGTSFTGVFDGNGHKISNLTITGENYIGLFGQLESGAEIKNLGIVDVNITGSDYVGGFVGFSKGNITNSYCNGAISGDQRVGGITGRNWSNNITACYSTATITANSDAGGIAANNYGSITNCYNTGPISSYRDAAGLVGENYGTIDKCYSIGAVSGDSRPGGLVSYNWPDGGIVSGFWDTETSGQLISDGGTGKTTAELQTATTFLDAGWDFVNETANGTEDIWWILEGQDYPRIWWEDGN